MVKVAGTVGRLASVGLMGREREGRDGAAVAATSIRGNPRRTVLQGIDILLGERVGLLINLTHGWPGVVEFSSGREVATDGHEGTDEAGKNSKTKEGESGRIGDDSNEEARKFGIGKNTYRI